MGVAGHGGRQEGKRLGNRVVSMHFWLKKGSFHVILSVKEKMPRSDLWVTVVVTGRDGSSLGDWVCLDDSWKLPPYLAMSKRQMCLWLIGFCGPKRHGQFNLANFGVPPSKWPFFFGAKGQNLNSQSVHQIFHTIGFQNIKFVDILSI